MTFKFKLEQHESYRLWHQLNNDLTDYTVIYYKEGIYASSSGFTQEARSQASHFGIRWLKLPFSTEERDSVAPVAYKRKEMSWYELESIVGKHIIREYRCVTIGDILRFLDKESIVVTRLTLEEVLRKLVHERKGVINFSIFSYIFIDFSSTVDNTSDFN
ncbi:MAG: hypothetical protein ACE5OZ_25405 [Candidatus Heimdallarchaeota archaeon]